MCPRWRIRRKSRICHDVLGAFFVYFYGFIHVRDGFQAFFVILDPDFTAGFPDGFFRHPAGSTGAAPVAADDAYRAVQFLRKFTFEIIADSGKIGEVILCKTAPLPEITEIHSVFHAFVGDLRIIKKADRSTFFRR